MARTAARPGTRTRRSAGGATSWQAATAPRRLAGRWRILTAVGVVALLATTLVCSLAMLVSAAEGRSVHAALTADPDRAAVTVVTENLTEPVADVRAAVLDTIVDRVGPGRTGATAAYSHLYETPREGRRPAFVYLAELSGPDERAVLVEGGWPDGEVADDGVVPVAVPVVARDAIDAALGTTHALTATQDGQDVVVRVVGFYDVPWPDESWSADRFRGRLHDPRYAVPGSAGLLTTEAVGPLVVAADGLAAAGAHVARATTTYLPDLTATDADGVAGLRARFTTVDAGIAQVVGSTAQRTRVSTGLPALLDEVSTRVVATRAGVAVVGLLLGVLAIAALLQTARLLAEGRHEEHDLMRARGASKRQLLVGAVLEAVPLMVAVAVLAPLLAPPALRALGSATGLLALVDGPSASTWLVAAGVALGLGVVLVLPLVRAPDTFHEAQQSRARPDRRAVLSRSGVDVVLLLLAGVAYWQLSRYRSPVQGAGGALGPDPVLVVGPVVVLLAGVFVCVRLLPRVARTAELLAARGRGVVGPLAAWEVGRRTSRATSAVLLLAIALAVTAFSQALLATWTQSQADRTWEAHGAPVVVEDLAASTVQQVTRLAHPRAGTAQPVVDADGRLWASGTSVTTRQTPRGGTSVRVRALTAPAREMLDRGRLAAEGGAVVAALPSPDVAHQGGIDLGPDAVGLAATLALTSEDLVTTGETDLPQTGLTATVRALVEDGTGLVRPVELGAVLLNDVDGPVAVRALLDGPAVDPGERVPPLRLVGLAVEAANGQGGELPRTVNAHLVLDDVRVVRSDAPVSPDPRQGAEALAALPAAPLDTTAARDWFVSGLGADVVALPQTRGSVGSSGLSGVVTLSPFSLEQGPVVATRTAWEPGERVPAVLTAGAAADLLLERGDLAILGVGDAVVPIEVAAVTDRIPTSGTRDGVVVDTLALTRVAAAQSVDPPPVSRWWVDVEAADVDEYAAHLAALPPEVDGSRTVDRVVVTEHEVADRQGGPVDAPLPAALWLATAGAALVAALGFAVHTVVTVRARELEFAQLRATGLPRRWLDGVLAVETLLLSGLGLVFGLGTGVLLARLVGPLAGTSTDGRAPVPAVEPVVPWADVLLVAAGVVALLMLVVLVVVRVVRTAEPGFVLRSEAGR